MPKHLRVVPPEPTEEEPLAQTEPEVPAEPEARIEQDVPAEPDASAEPDLDAALAAAEKKMRALDEAEDAIDAAFGTGKADRARITRKAQLDAAEAVAMVGEAMEADEAADEAARLAVIAENMGDRKKTRTARKRAKTARREAKQAHKAATKSARTAYDAIRFSQPGKLGLLRFVQIAYAFNIASTLLALILTSRDTITYNSVTIFSWITIILQGVALWFLINYLKQAKNAVILTSAFCIVTNIITSIVTGSFTVFDSVLNNVWYIFLIVYFLRSKRVGTVLVNDFSTFRPKIREETTLQRGGWPLVRNLIIYFIVFSVLGHWMEAAMCQLIRFGLVQGEYDPTNTMLWRDWLYPYPMEGAAVVIIALVLYPLWQYLLKRFEEKPVVAYALSFLANALTCSVIEFSMGLIVNADHQLWDYSDMVGNIMGQVCLQNTAAFGVAASIIAWVVYPMMERWLARISNDTMNIAFVIIAIIGGILWSLYIIDPPENHHYEVEPIETTDPAQEERHDYDVPIITADGTIAAMREMTSNSHSLPEDERTDIEQHLNDMQTELDEIKRIVHYDEAA